jgi:hypothetical protein
VNTRGEAVPFCRETCITAHGKSKSDIQSRPKLRDDWNIVAEYPGADPREITGLKNKADVDDWMNGDRRVAWLRSQGYAK